MSKAKVDERVVIDSYPFYIGIFVKEEWKIITSLRIRLNEYWQFK